MCKINRYQSHFCYLKCLILTNVSLFYRIFSSDEASINDFQPLFDLNQLTIDFSLGLATTAFVNFDYLVCNLLGS